MIALRSLEGAPDLLRVRGAGNRSDRRQLGSRGLHLEPQSERGTSPLLVANRHGLIVGAKYFRTRQIFGDCRDTFCDEVNALGINTNVEGDCLSLIGPVADSIRYRLNARDSGTRCQKLRLRKVKRNEWTVDSIES